jgi:serine O-acetyltransferase
MYKAGEVRRAYLKLVGMFLGISVPPGTFAGGLSLPHYGSIVVNDKVKAGRFCRIHSAVNMGETSEGAPVLGDGVYVGPGAVLYGPIVVGDRAVIGANSVVSINVPANSMAVGVPARIVKRNAASSVLPSWIDDAVTDLETRAECNAKSPQVGANLDHQPKSQDAPN